MSHGKWAGSYVERREGGSGDTCRDGKLAGRYVGRGEESREIRRVMEAGREIRRAMENWLAG